MPREHGSWSLAFEPLALGLLVAPSVPGSLLALAVASAFFARRPLKLIVDERRPDRRAAASAALLACAVVGGLFFASALTIGDVAWTWWLLPSSIAGAIFLRFDLRHGGREEAAEVAGAAAFAFLPAALAALAGEPNLTAFALAIVMVGRAVPAVLCVRAVLRGAKTGVHRPGFALAAATVALAAGIALARAGLAPWAAVFLLAVLALRAIALLAFPRPALRARTLGMIEAALGLIFVVAVGIAWHR